MGTIIVGIVILAAVLLVTRHIISEKRKGKLCIGGCSGCSMSGNCPSETRQGDGGFVPLLPPKKK